jgi:hypothetical protein
MKGIFICTKADKSIAKILGLMGIRAFTMKFLLKRCKERKIIEKPLRPDSTSKLNSMLRQGYSLLFFSFFPSADAQVASNLALIMF